MLSALAGWFSFISLALAITNILFIVADRDNGETDNIHEAVNIVGWIVGAVVFGIIAAFV